MPRARGAAAAALALAALAAALAPAPAAAQNPAWCAGERCKPVFAGAAAPWRRVPDAKRYDDDDGYAARNAGLEALGRDASAEYFFNTTQRETPTCVYKQKARTADGKEATNVWWVGQTHTQWYFVQDPLGKPGKGNETYIKVANATKFYVDIDSWMGEATMVGGRVVASRARKIVDKTDEKWCLRGPTLMPYDIEGPCTKKDEDRGHSIFCLCFPNCMWPEIPSPPPPPAPPAPPPPPPPPDRAEARLLAPDLAAGAADLAPRLAAMMGLPPEAVTLSLDGGALLVATPPGADAVVHARAVEAALAALGVPRAGFDLRAFVADVEVDPALLAPPPPPPPPPASGGGVPVGAVVGAALGGAALLAAAGVLVAVLRGRRKAAAARPLRRGASGPVRGASGLVRGGSGLVRGGSGLVRGGSAHINLGGASKV